MIKSNLITVVIPVFNQRSFCIEAVESICSQTYRNLEVIVVDDGSVDGSGDLLSRRFGDRIDLVRQGNSGPSEAINAGLSRARGDFIALMGGDDICVPERLEEQLNFLLDKNLDVVFSRPRLIDSGGNELCDDSYPVFFRPVTSQQSLLRSLFFDDNFLCAPSALMRSKVTRIVGKFHPGLIQLQDYDFWLRACVNGFNIGITERRLIRYRRHRGNLSSEDRGEASVSELPYVLAKLLRSAPADTMRAAFRDILVPTVNHARPLSEFEKSLLLLAHPRREVRIEGLSIARDLMEDPKIMQELSHRGINFFRFLYNSSQPIASAGSRTDDALN